MPLGAGDIPRIQEVARVCFEHLWREGDFAYFLNHDCGRAWAILAENRIAAYFLGLQVINELDIVSIATHPDFRRRGLGERLLRFALSQRGVTRTTLEVDVENETAQRLYLKLGFEAKGRRRGYYAGNRDALLMVRETMTFLRRVPQKRGAGDALHQS